MTKGLFSTFFIFCFSLCFGQVPVNKQPAIAEVKQVPPKIMLITFDPRMYISEVDQNINKETKMTFKQIIHAFQKSFEGVLVSQFKPSYNVVSLMADTAKTSKDLKLIHYSVDYKYEQVPAPGQLLPAKEKEKPKATFTNGIIDKGMSEPEKKFMNTRINSKTLLGQLHKKYKTEIFLFINELDIKASTDFDEATGAYQRDVAVHYSVFNKDGKQLCAGLAETRCPSSVNVPSKIAGSYFTPLAKVIFASFQKALLIP